MSITNKMVYQTLISLIYILTCFLSHIYIFSIVVNIFCLENHITKTQNTKKNTKLTVWHNENFEPKKIRPC